MRTKTAPCFERYCAPFTGSFEGSCQGSFKGSFREVLKGFGVPGFRVQGLGIRV